MRDVAIIGVASGWGAQDRRCGDGPLFLRDSGILHCLNGAARKISGFEILHVAESMQSRDVLARVAELDQRLALLISAKLEERVLPVVVGGDHACAVGTWSGVRTALPPHEELGLIWIDAHMDSHVPATSPSGALHGMPLACLLGEGPASLTELAGPSPKLRPGNVSLVGVRSFESGERALLESLGVRIFYMNEVRTRGFAAVWSEAVEHVTQGTAGYGVTIDLDAVDPGDAPGVGTPECEGIAGDDLIHAVRELHDDPKLLAVEIAEYNPYEDRERLTLRLLRRLICAAVAGKERDE
jgi:arginase